MDRGHRSQAPDFARATEAETEQLTLFDPGVDMSHLRKVRDQLTAALPANTRAALDSDWSHFDDWCESVGRRSLPASSETVELYAVHCASKLGHRVGTIRRRMWAIGRMHAGGGFPSPTQRDSVREVMAGLARELGCQQIGKAALTVEELRKMCETLDPETRLGARNRALLLVGFSTGLRSANLVQLQMSDVRLMKKGAEVRVRREKNDQQGNGRWIGIVRGDGVLDAVGALENWIRIRGRDPGRLFPIHVKHVWNIVREASDAAGLDSARIGTHSLRAGMITALDAAGVSVPAIMSRSGHRSYEMVARYVRLRNAYATDPLAQPGAVAKRA